MSEIETALIASEPEPTLSKDGKVHGNIPLKISLLLVLINILWAASTIPAKIALDGSPDQHSALGPATVAFTRFSIASLLLFVMLRVRGHVLKIGRSDRVPFIMLGTFGLAVSYLIFYSGLRHSTATETTLLIAAEPILITLIARIFLKERLRPIQYAGMAIGFAGVYIIVCKGLIPHFSGAVIANIVITAGLVFESSSSVLGKRLAYLYPGLVVLTIEMLVGSAVLLPFAAYELATKPPVHVTWMLVSSMAYLALICSFFCYGVWYWILPRLHVSRMAGFLFIQPVMGPVYAFLLLRESLRLWSAIGAILVVIGVWFVAVFGERAQDKS